MVQPAWTTTQGAFEFGRELIDALAASEDAYTISGYLTRSFADTPIFVVDELQQYEPLTPYYLPEVLEQIHNSQCVSSPTSVGTVLTSAKVTQNPATNAIVSAPANGSATSLDLAITPKLSLSAMVPSTIDVVEGSRLAAYLDHNNAGAIICGTEIPLFWNIINGVDATFTEFVASNLNTIISADLDGKAENFLIAPSFDMLQAMSAFDWAPRLTYGMTQVIASASQVVKAWEVWDIHNVTQLTEQDVKNINKMCLLSEFSSFGSF